MFDTSRIHPMLDKVQSYLGQWLEDHLKQIRPTDWWERCVLDVLLPEQRKNVLNDGAKNPSELDLSVQISVFKANWISLRGKFHLVQQLYNDAVSVKCIRNKYSHKKSSENYASRFEHDCETIRLFLKGLGVTEDATIEYSSIKENGFSDNTEKPMTFQNIIEAAHAALPTKVRRAPWIGIEHGVKPLDTDLKLDQYLAAYGKMHSEKIRMALDSLDNPEALLSAPVSIVDWGCGQGLATCCFFDWLRNNEIDFACISRVHLIDPSGLALQRAQANVARYDRQCNSHIDTHIANKFINDIQSSDLDIRDVNTTLHLFSNILDIDTVDLDFLAHFIKNTFTGRQIFCCVGPLNNGASRIMEFAEKFDITQAQIEARCQGKLAHCRGTVSMLTFVVDEGISSVRKVAIEPMAPMDVSSNITLQRLLNRHEPKREILDRILQFYLMSTELEQLKEPDIDNSTPFVMGDSGSCLFVSFNDNCLGDTPFALRCTDFAKRCMKNADPQQTKWPKDLHFALEVAWGGSVHRVLYATRPISELCQFDYLHGKITFYLNEFSVDLSIAEKLQLSDEKIAEIEHCLHSANASFTLLDNQIKSTIDQSAQLNTTQVYLSFSGRQIALSQTYAELKKLDAHSICKNLLLKAFLEHAEFGNAVDSVSPDELISALPMDEYQRKAIAHAINNRVSVVVGPPGCGKTQLLLNLMANALIRGKKVLVASKNNKAVDNIADRFSHFDGNGSFLRFGSQKYLRDITCPKIAGLLNIAQEENYDDEPYKMAFGKYQEAIVGLQGKDELIKELADFKDEYEVTHSNIQDLSNRFGVVHDIDSEVIKSIKEQLRKTIVEIDYRISGFSGLWTRIFCMRSIVKQALDVISGFPRDILEYLQTVDNRNCVSSFDSCAELIEFCQRYCNALDGILNDILCYRQSQEKLGRIKGCINEIEAKLSHIQEIVGEVRSVEFGKQLVSLTLNHYLHVNDSARAIAAYNSYIPENIPWRPNDVKDFILATKRFLNVCHLDSVTSLSVKNAFPIAEKLFDLLVIDEASQCDIASALPLILRAEQIVIIGDPMQLRHISKIDAEEELAIKRHLNLLGATHLKYSEESLWDYTRNWLPWCGNDAPCVLENHYRCHPDIIGYSNNMFYKTLAIGGLNVCTRRIDGDQQGVVWVDIQGKQASDTVNRNDFEAEKTVAIAEQYASEFTTATIGIVTPFKAQAERINALVPTGIRNRTIVDTVHKFQGDEKDIMIYSLVVTDNSPDGKIRWIDYKVPNLVNVAVTRAKRLLVIVGNRNYIKTHSRRDLPLGYLESYIQTIQARNNANANTR